MTNEERYKAALLLIIQNAQHVDGVSDCAEASCWGNNDDTYYAGQDSEAVWCANIALEALGMEPHPATPKED